MEKKENLTLKTLNERIACLETKINMLGSSMASMGKPNMAYLQPPIQLPHYPVPPVTMAGMPFPPSPRMDYIRPEAMREPLHTNGNNNTCVRPKSIFTSVMHPGVFCRYGGELKGKVRVAHATSDGCDEILLCMMNNGVREIDMVRVSILYAGYNKLALSVSLRGLVKEDGTPMMLTFTFDDYRANELFDNTTDSALTLVRALKQLIAKRAEVNDITIDNVNDEIARIFVGGNTTSEFASYGQRKLSVRLENDLFMSRDYHCDS